VKVSKDMIIRLPVEMKKFVAEGDEFVISVIGDSLRFKKVKRPDVLDLAASKTDKKSPTLEDISKIVHAMRGINESKGRDSQACQRRIHRGV